MIFEDAHSDTNDTRDESVSMKEWKIGDYLGYKSVLSHVHPMHVNV